MGSTILLADSAADGRASFLSAVRNSSFRVVAEVDQFDRLMEACKRNRPWCVAVDLQLAGIGVPPQPALAAIRQIHEQYPQARILVTHTGAPADVVMNAVTAGGNVIYSKTAPREHLLRALETLNAQSAPSPERNIAVRLKRTMAARWKEEGLFAKWHEALTNEIGLTGLSIQAADRIPRGKILAFELVMPGEPALHAKVQVQGSEPVHGFSHHNVSLTWAEMQPPQRERLRSFMMRLIERASNIASRPPAV
jgi:DNA-binding NarL/FixJ family response regulator